jgi:excisionase family DNA binding protein
MYQLEQGLGKALRAQEIAQYLDVDVKTVRKYYHELGGIRLGRHYRFFEKEIYYAIQKRTKVGRPSKEREPEIGKGVVEREDHHGLFE